jgi:hypothetical protein
MDQIHRDPLGLAAELDAQAVRDEGALFGLQRFEPPDAVAEPLVSVQPSRHGWLATRPGSYCSDLEVFEYNRLVSCVRQ